MFQSQGKYEQACEYFEAALAIDKQVLGEQHPDTALVLNNLGAVLLYQGKYTSARPYLEQALKIYEQLHGDKHPKLVYILSNLAQVMVFLKQFERARHYVTRALAICKETTEEYEECIKMRHLLRSLPGPIGRHKKKK